MDMKVRFVVSHYRQSGQDGPAWGGRLSFIMEYSRPASSNVAWGLTMIVTFSASAFLIVAGSGFLSFVKIMADIPLMTATATILGCVCSVIHSSWSSLCAITSERRSLM